MARAEQWRLPPTGEVDPRAERLQAAVEEGLSLEEAGSVLGLTLPLAKAVFVRSGLPVPRPLRRPATGPAVSPAERSRIASTLARGRPARPARERYTDEAILIGLKVMSVTRARWTSRTSTQVLVTMAYWNAHRDASVHPTALEVSARFGGWAAACEAAGIPVHGAARSKAKR